MEVYDKEKITKWSALWMWYDLILNSVNLWNVFIKLTYQPINRNVFHLQ